MRRNSRSGSAARKLHGRTLRGKTPSEAERKRLSQKFDEAIKVLVFIAGEIRVNPKDDKLTEQLEEATSQVANSAFELVLCLLKMERKMPAELDQALNNMNHAEVAFDNAFDELINLKQAMDEFRDFPPAFNAAFGELINLKRAMDEAIENVTKAA